MTRLEEMVSAIRHAGDMIHGGRPEHFAAEWHGLGFTVAEAEAWWEAGAFDAESALRLADVGLSAGDVAADHVWPNDESTGFSVAYTHSNGDLTTGDVVRIVEG